MYAGRHRIAWLMVVMLQLGFSSAYSQITWDKNPNPVLNLGSPGSWDDSSARASSVLYVGNEYKMWYVGNHGFGYASSPDGLTWTKSQANPVLLPGVPSSWDGGGLAHASVLIVNGTYHMWYNALDALHDNRIGYATSSDGIHWNKYAANPVLDLGSSGAWDDHEVMHPFVLLDGSIYRMYYNGYGNQSQRIGLATSPDGIKWTKHPANPLLAPGALGSWDDNELGPACVLPSQNQYLMLYFASSRNGNYRIGYATSTDWVHWTKYPANPVLSAGAQGAWDDGGVANPIAMLKDSVYRLWYSGAHWPYIRTGFATSRNVISSVEDGHGFQPEYTLRQNYPNPFNPNTTISYELPATSHVRLEVFDVLGRLVATLVNGIEEPGHKSVRFDGNKLASGTYIYRLQVGAVAIWKKLLLLR